MLYPLTSGYRATYWVLSILMFASLIRAYAKGSIGIPGGFGLAVAIALYLDYGVRKRVESTELASKSVSQVSTSSKDVAPARVTNPLPPASMPGLERPRPPSDASTMHFPGAIDESLWAEAAAEWEGRGRRSGLWARLFAEANGDANLAKATYLSERFRELKEATVSNVAQLCKTKESSTQDSEDHQPTSSAKSVDNKLDDLRAFVRAFGHYRHAVAVAEALGYTVEEVGMGFFRDVAVRVVADNQMHMFDSHKEFIEWAKAAG